MPAALQSYLPGLEQLAGLAALFAVAAGFALIGGVIADRLPRQFVLVGSSLAAMATQAAIAATVLTETATIPVLLVLSGWPRLGEYDFSSVRFTLVGAAPVAPEVLQFFMGIGIPMHELYGMTENVAIATVNRQGRVKLGTVGEPQEGIDFRIDDETGEILTRHPGVFAGYWRDPEATARTVDADGWLHTGDVGEWVDGTHIRITDRMKDIIITAGGKNIAPSEIENALKASPFIKEAIVIGDRRKYLTALIGIDYEVVSEWAQRRRIPHTTYRDLSEKPEVVALVDKAVKETNEKFARVEQIKTFRLMTKELDHEDGELTATQKVKRSIIESRFAVLIESMY